MNENNNKDSYDTTMENSIDTTNSNSDEAAFHKRVIFIAQIQGAVCCLLVIAVLFVCAYIPARKGIGPLAGIIPLKGSTGDILSQSQYTELNKMYDYINANFLFDYDEEALVDGIYKGMFSALDDKYSAYYNKEEFKELMDTGNGTFEGIGAYLQLDEESGYTKVLRTIHDSPAEAIGVLKDDLIYEVDGESMKDVDVDYVASKVRGPKGTAVHIVFKRGEELIEYDIERHTVYEDSVASEVLDDKIGYLAISSFDDDTNLEFERHMSNLTDQGINALIIDLRSNGGGYVDTAADIADQILDEGNIVTIKYKNGTSYAYNSDAERKLDLPIVLIIDKDTASASEILTGALRDYGVATTVGTTSFGKGIVQDVLDMDNGTGFKLTVAQYFTPNGECIHQKGITPDIYVKFDKDSYINDGIDNQLEKAKEIIKEKIK
ncbi:MAG: S41 family peptidase [Lachnospiraceae bacterium]|nr:S41 family peptidase [Lachnospiraceae bacterium]